MCFCCKVFIILVHRLFAAFPIKTHIILAPRVCHNQGLAILFWLCPPLHPHRVTSCAQIHLLSHFWPLPLLFPSSVWPWQVHLQHSSELLHDVMFPLHWMPSGPPLDIHNTLHAFPLTIPALNNIVILSVCAFF